MPQAEVPPALRLQYAQELHALLHSPGWQRYMVPRIGRTALEARAARALDEHPPEAARLRDHAVAHRTLDTLRTELETELQHALQFLHKNALLTPELQSALLPTAAPETSLGIDEADNFDPFGPEPPHR